MYFYVFLCAECILYFVECMFMECIFYIFDSDNRHYNRCFPFPILQSKINNSKFIIQKKINCTHNLTKPSLIIIYPFQKRKCISEKDAF